MGRSMCICGTHVDGAFCNLRLVTNTVRIDAASHQGQPAHQQIKKQLFHEFEFSSELKRGKMKSLDKQMDLAFAFSSN